MHMYIDITKYDILHNEPYFNPATCNEITVPEKSATVYMCVRGSDFTFCFYGLRLDFGIVPKM